MLQSQSSIYEGLELGGADENLADLQPEDSDGEDDDQTSLVDLAHEQQVCACMLVACVHACVHVQGGGAS